MVYSCKLSNLVSILFITTVVVVVVVVEAQFKNVPATQLLVMVRVTGVTAGMVEVEIIDAVTNKALP